MRGAGIWMYDGLFIYKRALLPTSGPPSYWQPRLPLKLGRPSSFAVKSAMLLKSLSDSENGWGESNCHPPGPKNLPLFEKKTKKKTGKNSCVFEFLNPDTEELVQMMFLSKLDDV